MVIIVSSFIPIEGFFMIRKETLETAKTLIEIFRDVKVVTQHQTVKILGLTPAKERISLSEKDLKNKIQLWIKPKRRLEFGREYSLDEILDIGFDIYIAYPLETEEVETIEEEVKNGC